MKNVNFWMSAVVAGFLPAVGFAEGGGDKDWAEKAAIQYEEKAAKATDEGNAHDAAIYLKMAQIKRNAGAAAKEGKEFSWDEYHALNGQLGGGEKGKGEDTKGKHESDEEKAGHKDESHDKKVEVDEKTKETPASGFIKTSQEYQQKCIEAMESGDTEKASIYMELAKMKLDAAMAVQQGKDYDWTRYHELLKNLND